MADVPTFDGDGDWPQEVPVANERTGEVIEYQRPKPKVKRGTKPPTQIDAGHWTKFYDSGLYRLMALTGTELHVFFALVRETGVDRSFRFSTNEIADMLNIAPSQVSRALRTLKQHGILIRVGKTRSWFIDPRIMWRGNDSARNSALETVSSTLDEPSRKDTPA
jgi:hypothetical protein